MSLIMEYGFDIKVGELSDFHAWLSENESKFADSCPDGVEYVGTYGVIYSSEKHAGGCRQHFRLASYRAQDALSAAIKENGAFASLLNDMNRPTLSSRNRYRSEWNHAVSPACEMIFRPLRFCS